MEEVYKLIFSFFKKKSVSFNLLLLNFLTEVSSLPHGLTQIKPINNSKFLELNDVHTYSSF